MLFPDMVVKSAVKHTIKHIEKDANISDYVFNCTPSFVNTAPPPEPPLSRRRLGLPLPAVSPPPPPLSPAHTAGVLRTCSPALSSIPQLPLGRSTTLASPCHGRALGKTATSHCQTTNRNVRTPRSRWNSPAPHRCDPPLQVACASKYPPCAAS